MVIVDKNEFDTGLEGDPEALTVQEALNRTVRSRRVGGLAVDTESLRVGETGERIILVRLANGDDSWVSLYSLIHIYILLP